MSLRVAPPPLRNTNTPKDSPRHQRGRFSPPPPERPPGNRPMSKGAPKRNPDDTPLSDLRGQLTDPASVRGQALSTRSPNTALQSGSTRWRSSQGQKEHWWAADRSNGDQHTAGGGWERRDGTLVPESCCIISSSPSPLPTNISVCKRSPCHFPHRPCRLCSYRSPARDIASREIFGACFWQCVILSDGI